MKKGILADLIATNKRVDPDLLKRSLDVVKVLKETGHGGSSYEIALPFARTTKIVTVFDEKTLRSAKPDKNR